MKKNITRNFFLLATLEGTAALFLYFSIGSMERNAVLWGLSLSRLALGAAVLVLWAGLVSYTIFLYLNARQEDRFRDGLTRLLPDNERFVTAVVVLVFGILLELGVIAIYFSNTGN